MLALVFVLCAHATLADLNRLVPPFQRPTLPYAEHSLEAAVDAETMRVHYRKHHEAYVNKLNQALGKSKLHLGDILTDASQRDPQVRNNAGGHWNHSFFWTVMTPKSDEQKMPNRLEQAIAKKFGSVKRFQEQFAFAGKAVFGSGWVWLIRTPQGDLAITTTPNQDNPLMDVAPLRGTPIFAVDVWEHAYYLRYQNKRDDYLEKFWQIVNWRQVDSYDREALGENLK